MNEIRAGSGASARLRGPAGRESSRGRDHESRPAARAAAERGITVRFGAGHSRSPSGARAANLPAGHGSMGCGTERPRGTAPPPRAEKGKITAALGRQQPAHPARPSAHRRLSSVPFCKVLRDRRRLQQPTGGVAGRRTPSPGPGDRVPASRSTARTVHSRASPAPRGGSMRRSMPAATQQCRTDIIASPQRPSRAHGQLAPMAT